LFSLAPHWVWQRTDTSWPASGAQAKYVYHLRREGRSEHLCIIIISISSSNEAGRMRGELTEAVCSADVQSVLKPE